MVVIAKISFSVFLTVMAILSIPASGQNFRCPSRWTMDSVNLKCYLVTKDSMNWDDARRSCSELGGGLAIFKNEQESEFVKDNLDLTSNIWIGLKNLNSEWIWVDGTTAAFTEWAHFQPSVVFDEPLSSKNCVEMRRLKKYLWRNRLCTTLNRALCERYAESTVRYTCPEKWFRNFDVCYHISTERVTYDEAAKKCPTLDFESKFFAPRNSIENNFISGKLKEEKINSVWIGINDVDEEENFETEDEAKQTFFNWDNREPSDTFNKLIKNNDCVKLSSTSKMSDENCLNRYQFVCSFIL